MYSFNQEVKNFIQAWPNIEFIDLIFTDLNGSPRGKRIPIDALSKVEKGIYLPISTISLDVAGSVIEEAGLGEELGEPDHICYPIEESLVPTSNPKVGQLLLTMMDEDGNKPTTLSIRNVLSNFIDTLHQQNKFPVIALELEFYLVDKSRTEQGMLQTAINPSKHEREYDTGVYDIDSLDDYSEFLFDLNSAAQLQGLNTSGALSESAPGQFEINFNHQQDILDACDQVILAKRLIRQVAQKHNFDATFMAKPFQEQAGNGMHIHLSIIDEHGNNLFSNSDENPSDFFYQVLSSMLSFIPSSTALLCPNINSYRRFCVGSYTPTKADWGENHRGVALRIPMSDSKNRRIEHRIAGADVNPYLLTAVIMSNVIASTKFTADQCPPPLEDNPKDIPCNMEKALDALQESELNCYFPPEFIELYIACKKSELAEFDKAITPLEIEWMLHSA